ncbi:putative nuclease HARBI1 [Colias croceus]|uniref:putative nuclease HARBI1 n=1 Tax=Colias crocea TaxID=72248 RepID=UPI001E27B175|nr:putative nuclease HARBI1 [Colias croceus]
MMVPYTGKKAGYRKQYVKNKPKKWGYKIFVRAGVSGFVYDLIIYGGEDTFRLANLSPVESSFGLGAKIVVALCKTILNPAYNINIPESVSESNTEKVEESENLFTEYERFCISTIMKIIYLSELADTLCKYALPAARGRPSTSSLSSTSQGPPPKIRRGKECQTLPPLEVRLDQMDHSQIRTETRAYAKEVIDLIRVDIEHATKGGFCAELQVCTALRTWARQEIQDDAADIHGMSQQSITNICRRVATALARKAALFIYMPRTLEEEEEVIAGFRRICGFRNVVGAIDCTHIKIKKIGGESAQYYINRKGYYSLNVQVVCDSRLVIRDIVAHWRGSTHDSRIFRESRIKQRFENGEFHGRLLGDAGYGLTNYLFTPVQNPTNPKEEAYNKAHIHTRNTVERCFGVWKQRFRCLLHGFSVSLENVKLYKVALAVLHNIAIKMGENVDLIELGNPSFNDQPQDARGRGDARGEAARQLFINSYF